MSVVRAMRPLSARIDAPRCCPNCGGPMPGRRLVIRHRDETQLVDLTDVTVVRHREGSIELWGGGRMLGWVVNSSKTINLQRWPVEYPDFVQVSRFAAVRRSSVQRVNWHGSDPRRRRPVLRVDGMDVQVSRRMAGAVLRALGVLRPR